MDYLRVIVTLHVCSVFIAVLTALTIIWHNRTSSALVLTGAAFIGTALATFVQAYFELQRSSSKQFFSTEYTIDRAKPEIRQWRYSTDEITRLTVEAEASRAAARDGLFGDRERLTRDLAVVSFLAFMGVKEFDWQAEPRTYSGSLGMTLTEGKSQPRECSSVSRQDLENALVHANNPFARVQFLVVRALCLPPGTGLEVQPAAVILRNSFSEIRFTFTADAGTLFTKPFSQGEQPTLPNGEPQYETRGVGIRVDITHFALRTKHPAAAVYRDWGARLIERAQAWYAFPPMPRPAGGPEVM